MMVVIVWLITDCDDGIDYYDDRRRRRKEPDQQHFKHHLFSSDSPGFADKIC